MKKIIIVCLVLMFCLSGFVIGNPAKCENRIASTESADRTVLVECFTGTWCTYCQGAEGALDRLADEYPRTQLTIIEWHNKDDYVTVDNSGPEREDFYAVSSFPTSYFDGLNPVSGGSTDPDNEDIYNEYKDEIDSRLSVSSPLNIITKGYIDGNKAVINANITAVGSVALSNLYAYFVLYNDEDETVYVEGREYRLRYTALKSGSEQISIKSGEIVNIHKEFSLQSKWDRDKLGVVTFVQTHNKESHIGGIPPKQYYTAEVLQSNDFRYTNASVTPEKTTDNIYKGGEAVFDVELENTRTTSDTYTLSLTKNLPSGWSSNFCIGSACYSSTATVQLNAGESETVSVHIFSSENALSGDKGIVTLTITSQIKPDGKSAVTFTATILSGPTQPTITFESASATSITISWTKNTDSNFDRYEIHTSTSSGFTPTNTTLVKTLITQNTISWEVTGLTEDTEYYFKLRVYDTNSQYSDSNEINAKTSKTETEGGRGIPGFDIGMLIVALVVIFILRKRFVK
ncbi:MAG: fibronectin type III domain-containing protein [Candidatus Thermoplasmatota archaeon]|nr:fibronectin type III domain-containing protein [Candidatus Thermoplasmatota archaeon]